MQYMTMVPEQAHRVAMFQLLQQQIMVGFYCIYTQMNAQYDCHTASTIISILIQILLE